MKNVIIDVSKKDEKTKKYVKQGEVVITVPTLEDILTFAAAKVTGEEDGLPVYDKEEANWLQAAMLSYVKANARNKLISGTAQVKEGLKIPTNWEELCAEGERGGNGAALAALRDSKAAFAAWVATQGKSESASNTLITLFGNKAALSLQSAANKEKMKGYIESFAEALSEADLERYTRPIEALVAACDSVTDEDF